MNTFNLKIITPKGIYFDDKAKQINLKTSDGSIGILANHSPLIGEIEICIMEIIDSKNNKESFAIHAGFLNVKQKEVVIITEAIENKAEIDKIRANNSKDKYEKLLKESSQDYATAHIELSLKKAINRLKL